MISQSARGGHTREQRVDGTEQLAATIAARVDAATIDEVPFPHIVIDEFLPSAVYTEILRQIPPRSEFDALRYLGTGFGARGAHYHDFGYVFPRTAVATGLLGTLDAAVGSEQFARALLEKFGNHALAVPHYKRSSFVDDSTEFITVVDLQVDLPGYAIAPHADVASELINFQLDLVEDSVAQYRTCFCIPDDPRVYKGRKRVEAALGALLSRMPRHNRLVRTLERSSVGLRLGVGVTAGWLPWGWFKTVKVVEAVPNRFVAFAPNDRSFHAADFSVSAEAPAPERAVLRGSIRVGRGSAGAARGQLLNRGRRAKRTKAF